MKIGRETIIAIILGFSLGFAVAAGIFILPNVYKPKVKSDIPTVMNDAKTIFSNSAQILTLTKPEDQSSVAGKGVSVSGKFKPNATIVISSPAADAVVLTNNDATFEATADINQGPNQLLVTGYTGDGSNESITRTVYRIDIEVNP